MSIETKFGTAYKNSQGYMVISSMKEGNHNKFLHRIPNVIKEKRCILLIFWSYEKELSIKDCLGLFIDEEKVRLEFSENTAIKLLTVIQWQTLKNWCENTIPLKVKTPANMKNDAKQNAPALNTGTDNGKQQH